ncbi:hypothetical protein BH11PSE11_BH11PSE11_16450 [soil metagenome]
MTQGSNQGSNQDGKAVAAPSDEEIKALIALFNQRRFAEAETFAHSFTIAFPQHGFGWKVLGALYQQQGRLQDALAPMRKAAELMPDDAVAHSNLGVALMEQGLLIDAEASARRAVSADPNYAVAHSNLGNILKGQARLGEAEASLRKALQLNPDYIDALSNLGVVQKEQGRFSEAEASYRQAIKLKPDMAAAHNNLGNVLKAQSRLVEAEHCYRRALEINPDFGEAHQNLSLILAYLSDYRQVVEESNQALRLRPDGPMIWEQRLYAFSYHADLSAADIFKEFVNWGDRFPEPQSEFSTHDRSSARRLRIGYVSPDFRRHSSRLYFKPLFSNHDHDQVELFAYANVRIEDDFTTEFKGMFENWRDIRGLSDRDAAALIQRDRIDILVDCCNHMEDARLDIFALKPAPVQVTWLGAAWTTGLKSVDYVLFDPYLAPPETLARETIVRLPHFFVAYEPPPVTADLAPPPCLQNGFITFAYSGRSERLNHRTFRVWGEILRRVPGSKLVLDYRQFSDPPTQEHYRKFMAEHGVDVERVVMRWSGNIYAGLNEFDILLDSFPHSGGTMLFDAIWMGVPAVTLAGRPPLGRIGTSLLMNLGLPEWVAYSEEEYTAKACAFAANPELLMTLRAGMRERMRASPIMDGIGFTRAVESAYRAMFQKWSEPAASETGSNAASEPSEQEIAAVMTAFAEARLADAEALARRLSLRYPGHGFGWKALGGAVLHQGRLAEAAVHVQMAAALSPGDAESHRNLAYLYRELGRKAEAEQQFRLMLAITPDIATAHNDLGVTILEQGRRDEAEACFRRALEIKPDYEGAFSGLLFSLNYHADLSAQEIFEIYREYDARFGVPLRQEWRPHANAGMQSARAQRRLKIGYVSPDFRRHSAVHFLEPLLAHHDKNAFEVTAFAELGKEDAVTQRYKQYVDHWVPTAGLSDAALAERIRADGIDILVDLAGHTAKNRLGVFARKPAPVSLTWLGYGYTTGLSAVDYMMTDGISAPEGSEGFFSEAPWRLPTPGYVYRPAEGMGPVSPLPAIRHGFVTFGTLTRAIRINHHTVRVWSEILTQVDGAQLVIDSENFQESATQQTLLAQFAAHGIGPERLRLGYHSPPWDLLREIDISLDCFPHNSGTTLFESLYMGVPYVTLAGRPSVGRVGSSVLHGVGHPEWIAGSEEEYVKIAVTLASDLVKLTEIRSQLRGEMEASALMDEPAFALKVEAAYRAMFVAWCEKN